MKFIISNRTYIKKGMIFMKSFWKWLLKLFKIKPNTIPKEILNGTTAYVNPENFNPKDIENLKDKEEIKLP